MSIQLKRYTVYLIKIISCSELPHNWEKIWDQLKFKRKIFGTQWLLNLAGFSKLRAEIFYLELPTDWEMLALKYFYILFEFQKNIII